jgi:NAD(P)-dependent dehydrogenase (short-subunit alcohol dehydrogenase family)
VEEHLAQFNTNVFGVINVTNVFLPHWRARKQGTIVNISSMGSMLFIPGAGIYCASKVALDAVSETWVQELAPFNIRSVSIQACPPCGSQLYTSHNIFPVSQPGSFRTAVAESGNMKTAGIQIEGYDAPYAWVDTFNQTAGKERGDTVIAAVKIIELVSVDLSRALPGRLTIGEDAYVTGKTFYERGLKDLEEWKAFSTGTDAVDQ